MEIFAATDEDNMWPRNEFECEAKYANFSTTEGLYCSHIWDTIFCWPPTPAGQIAQIVCSVVLSSVEAALLQNNDAVAHRFCNSSGQWSRGNWTNYTQCLLMLPVQPERWMPLTIGYTVFVCSIISSIMLILSLAIFTHFKSLDCPRLKAHRNFSTSLLINSVSFTIISCPVVFTTQCNFYTNVDFLCKVILSIKMYSSLSTVNWMFLEGLLLHWRIATSVFRQSFPFKIFYLIGWGIPLLLICCWTLLLNRSLTTACWEGYGNLTITWIVTGPMILVLTVNFFFLVNIIRVMLTRTQRTQTAESNNVRKAIRAAILLFPLLGTTHLMVCFNPRIGNLEEVYMLCNAFLQSSQGIFVSFFYCFLNNDVQAAVRRKFVSSKARRSFEQEQCQQRRLSRRKTLEENIGQNPLRSPLFKAGESTKKLSSINVQIDEKRGAVAVHDDNQITNII